MSGPQAGDRLVTLGRIVGLLGVQGWVKVYSYARPPEAILSYDPWLIHTDAGWRELALGEGRRQGRGIVARLHGCDSREQASALIGADIAVPLARLPTLPQGEYYWAQLEGLRAVNLQGIVLGVVSHLFETGANDVLVVVPETASATVVATKDSRLIPYVDGVVRKIDLQSGVIVVDWGLDY
ncbi:MAG: ribosome maturation factor RimM [Acidiferrobacterales bacterium]